MGGKFRSEIGSYPNEINLVAHCYMLIAILVFIFSIFFYLNIFWQVLSQNLKFSELTGIFHRVILLCWSRFQRCFSFFVLIQVFVDKLDLRICCSPNWPKFTIGCIVMCWLRFLHFRFSISSSQILKEIWTFNIIFSKLD